MTQVLISGNEPLPSTPQHRFHAALATRRFNSSLCRIDAVSCFPVLSEFRMAENSRRAISQVGGYWSTRS